MPFALLPLLAAGADAQAAAAAQADSTAPAIVVTGMPLADLPVAPAYAVTTITRERLVQVPSGLIEDALSDAAGVQLFRRSDSRSANPSAEGFTLRALGGNAASRTLVLLDGVPQADPFFGAVPLSALNPAELGGARVIHGGGSGAFGAGAVAGTIDLTSAPASARGLVSGEALIDDRSDTRLAAALAPTLGQGFAVLSGQWDRGPGFWTTPVSQRVAASVKARYDRWSVAARAVAALNREIEVQARLAAFADNQVLRFAGAATGASGEDASVRLVGRGRWGFDALVYRQVRNFHAVTISAASFAPVNVQRDTPSTGSGAHLELRPPTGDRNALRLGSDWRGTSGFEDEDLYTRARISGHRREGGENDDFGIYGEDALTLGALVLSAGARGDRWSIRRGELDSAAANGATTGQTRYPDRAGWLASLRGAALFHALPGLDLRAAAYSGMRVPTLNELYRSFTVFPVTTLANPALVPERLRGYEGGIDWRLARGANVHVTGFDNRVANAIANITLNATSQQRRNVPAIRARGIEAAGDAQLGAVALAGSLVWTAARVEAPGQPFDGLRPPQVPRLAANAEARWSPRVGWALGATLRHTGRAYEDSLQTAALAAATTLGGFATTPLAHGFTLVLRGENLTNSTVVTRNSGGTIDLGTPRTLWIGVRLGP